MLGDDQFRVLERLLDVASLRAQVHAGNLANQNTPGYHARAVEFDSAFRQALANDGPDDALAIEPKIVEPRTTSTKVDGNDVAVDREVTALAQNRLLYDTYVAMLKGRKDLLMTAMSPPPGG
ncbi:hypothetical protein LBMAG53_08140 [Planctomycetota bacterium]|nr:hypothetical protein LBMAG53_08140 [Planctomycetota bacterium]